MEKYMICFGLHITPFCDMDYGKVHGKRVYSPGPAGGSASPLRRSKNAESQGQLPRACVNISESTSEKAHIII